MKISLSRSRFYSFLVVNSFIIVVAALIQHSLYLNSDVSTLLLFTERVLAGGSYTRDFFTPNPPLIFIIYMPVIFVHYLIGASKTFLLAVYVFVLSIISIMICYRLLRLITEFEYKFPLYLFCTLLMAVFLLLPVYDFGQRDHLLVVFTMPYFLSLALQIKGGKLNAAFAIFIAVFAGFGFALKPHFLITLLLLEIFFCIVNKNKFAWFRTQTIIILVFCGCYLLSIVLFFPEYIFNVLPYIAKYYYGSTLDSYLDLVMHPIFIFCCFPLLFYMVQIKNNQQETITTVLYVALIGFLLGFLLQNRHYFYHLIPAFSIATLVYALQGYLYIFENRDIKKIAVVFYALTWWLPGYLWMTRYHSGLEYKHQFLQPLVGFMKQINHENSFYIFSSLARIGFPLIEYTELKVAQRFDTIWMTDRLLKQMQHEGDKKIVQHFKNNDYLFLRMITQDFSERQPTLVIIEGSNNQLGVFNYLKYFLLNKNFAAEWKHYKYLTTIRFPGIERFLIIYKRS